MKIEISNGELVDKITILAIKLVKIKSEEKLKNIRKEYELLTAEMIKLNINEDTPEYKELLAINNKLWQIEDDIRLKEANQQFDDEFIQLARSVYFTNDERSKVKRRINELTGSDLYEEKEYAKYQK